MPMSAPLRRFVRSSAIVAVLAAAIAAGEPVALAPPATFAAPAGCSETAFADGVVITAWSCRSQAAPGLAGRVAGGAAGADELAGFAAIEPRVVLAESWPEVTPAIDLRALESAITVLCSLVRNDRERLVRADAGAAGRGAEAVLWLSGQRIEAGTLLRLAAGVHPLVIEARYVRPAGRNRTAGLAVLAPRLTAISAEDLAEHERALADERRREAERAAAPAPAVDFDPATLRGAAGAFRVGRSRNGVWWLIDPDGRPFHHRGCTGLNAGGKGGRIANLPPVPDGRAREWVGLLRDWGFNAMGAWTTSEFFALGMPFTEIIDAGYTPPHIAPRIPDVFDPRWTAVVEERCALICPPVRGNRDLVGYFLENEMPFMDFPRIDQRVVARAATWRPAGPIEGDAGLLAAEPQLDREHMTLLQLCLSLEPSLPAAAAAWSFVDGRHGGATQAGAAWGIALSDRAALRALSLRGERLIAAAFLADAAAWMERWVEQHHRVVCTAIRRHDGDHLILGMRHGGTPSAAVCAAEARWCDVVSRNNYRAEFFDLFDRYAALTGRPVINGEFSFNTDSYRFLRDPIEPPGGHDPVARATVRARRSIDGIARHPAVVGTTKYRWHGDFDGLWGDDGSPRMATIEPLRAANARTPAIAAQRERDATAPVGPLHGQVFLTLHDAHASSRELPAARAGEPASALITAAPLRLGLVCRQGVWDARVRGDGIAGSLRARTLPDGSEELELRLRVVADPLGRRPATVTATATVRTLPGGIVRGAFTGACEGIDVAGSAVGLLVSPSTCTTL